MKTIVTGEVIAVDGHYNLYVGVLILVYGDGSARTESRTFSGMDAYRDVCAFVRLGKRELARREVATKVVACEGLGLS